MLTPKNEKYCQAYLLLGNKSAAYREAYSTKNMKDKTINDKASLLSKKEEVRERIAELQKRLELKHEYTLNASIEKDLKLIERYENALQILSDPKSKKKEVETAERTIRFIGSSGYNSAQDRLSKQKGWYEKDNSQKPTIVNANIPKVQVIIE